MDIFHKTMTAEGRNMCTVTSCTKYSGKFMFSVTSKERFNCQPLTQFGVSQIFQYFLKLLLLIKAAFISQ